MQHLGLSHAEFQAYLRALRSSHLTAYRTTLRTLDMKVIGSVKPQVLSGQVLGDRHGFGHPHGPQRRLLLSLLDPNNALGIDTDSPEDGALYYDRLVQVVQGMLVGAELAGWVWCPIFTGRPSRLQRTDDVVDIEADDPSVMGMGAAWKPYTLPKGTLKVDAIRRILEPPRRCHPVHVPPLEGPAAPSRVAAPAHAPVGGGRADRALDGHAAVLHRRRSGGVAAAAHGPAVHVQHRPGGEITQPVATTDTMEGFANVWEVFGRNPKGPKKRVRAVVDRAAQPPVVAAAAGAGRGPVSGGAPDPQRPHPVPRGGPPGRRCGAWRTRCANAWTSPCRCCRCRSSTPATSSGR